MIICILFAYIPGESKDLDITVKRCFGKPGKEGKGGWQLAQLVLRVALEEEKKC